MTRVFVVDARELVRLALTTIVDTAPDIEVVGTAPGPDGVAAAIAATSPDTVVIGDGDDERGAALCRALAGRRDRPRIVVGAARASASRGALLLAGADDVFDLGEPTASILDRLRGGPSAGPVLEPAVTADLFDRLRSGSSGDPIATLTERELEILGRVAEGMTNPEIAATLHLSPKTVKNNVSSILKKLGMHTRTEAAVFAARRTGALG